MRKKGELVIDSTFLFILGFILLFILVVFYIYLRGKGITIIDNTLKLPSPM